MGGGSVNRLWFHLFLVLSFATIVLCDTDKCMYTVYVETGTVEYAGTDSKISLILYTASGDSFYVEDLISWGGAMGPGKSGRGPCLPGPVCKMTLKSDGSGEFPGWFCNYLEVTTTGVHIPCAKQLFGVPSMVVALPSTGTTALFKTAFRMTI